MLHGRGPGARADLLEDRPAVVPFGLHADLDQFVGGEGSLDFGQHSAGQALVADQHDRFQGMGARLEGAPFCRG